MNPATISNEHNSTSIIEYNQLLHTEVFFSSGSLALYAKKSLLISSNKKFLVSFNTISRESFAFVDCLPIYSFVSSAYFQRDSVNLENKSSVDFAFSANHVVYVAKQLSTRLFSLVNHSIFSL
jgi:hypothetical protein